MNFSRKVKPNDIELQYINDNSNAIVNEKRFASKEIFAVRSSPKINNHYGYRVGRQVRLLAGTFKQRHNNVLGYHTSPNWSIVVSIDCITSITADDVWGVPDETLEPLPATPEVFIKNNKKYTIYGDSYMSKKLLWKGDWLSIYDRKTPTGHWEYVERKSQSEAAVIIGITPKNEIVLIKQHRYPFDKTVIEFPAGLIDEGETPSETAIRELTEETGCSGEVLSVSPPIASSAGLTTEMLYFVEMLVTDTNGKQRLDDEEKIEWELVKLDDTILEKLEKDAKENDYILSSRLYAYFMGKKKCLRQNI